MRITAFAALLFVALPLVAQEAEPDARTLLKRAFDGAMTCSALTAMEADQALGDMQQTWANRSFAFGMLAVRFYTDLSGGAMSNDEMNEALNQYADALTSMSAEQIAPFREGCEAKYANVDELCEQNDCVFPRGAAAPSSLAPAD